MSGPGDPNMKVHHIVSIMVGNNVADDFIIMLGFPLSYEITK